MNHYEIVYIFNPDEKELGKSLFDSILETTKSLKGKVHRSEEIGSRRLAYPINDYYRGEYFLINLECNASELPAITDLFKFNENILRTSVLKKKQAETSKSALMEQTSNSSYEKDENLVKKVFEILTKFKDDPKKFGNIFTELFENDFKVQLNEISKVKKNFISNYLII